MTKRYFANKRKKDPSLGKIVAVLLVLIAGVYGILWGYVQLRESLFSEPVQVADSEGLVQAQDLLEQGDYAAARTLLEPAVQQGADPTLAARALVLQADLELAEGNEAAALGLLESFRSDYPQSPDYPVASARYARLLEAAGRGDEAAPIYEDLIDTAPPGLRAVALVGLGRRLEAQGDLIAARDLYSNALASAEWNTPVWDEAADALGPANVALAFAPMETPECKYYIVEKGDNLTTIGIKLNTTQGLLTRANGLDDPRKLRLQQRLKYTPKDFRIIIERSTCRLFLVDNNGLFRRYYTGLGMPGHETVLGKYTLGNKQKNPTWFKPGAGAVPAGDPANELGTRWMPMVPAEEGLPTDLGIHGTIAPETIGHYQSHGCPRMHKEDVEELYDLVVRSTPVEVIEVVDASHIFRPAKG